MSYLGGGTFTNDGGGTDAAASFSPAVIPGSLLTAVISWGSTSETCTGVVGGGTWQLIGSPVKDTTNGQSLQLAYCMNATGGATTATASFSGGVGFRRIVVSEYDGIATYNALDGQTGQSAACTTATDNVSSGSITPTQAGDLIVSGTMDTNTGGNPTHTAGTGFVKRAQAGACGIEDLTQISAAAVAGTWTYANAGRHATQVAAFKPAVPAPQYMVQERHTDTGFVSATTLAAPSMAALTNGSKILGYCSASAAGALTPTVTDTAGNIYTVLPGRFWTNVGFYVALFWCDNAATSAGNVVTVNFGSSVQLRQIAVAEFTGLGKGAPDVYTAGNNSSAADPATDVAMTTTLDRDLVVTVGAGDAAVTGPGTGFTLIGTAQTNTGSNWEYQTKATAGSITPTIDQASTTQMIVISAAFKSSLSNAYPAEVLGDGPILYLRLGEPTGPTAFDVSGNLRHATYGSTTVKGVAGAIDDDTDKAITTAGNSTDTADIAYAAWMNVSALTQECWWKTSLVSFTEYAIGRTGGINANYTLAKHSSGAVQVTTRTTGGQKTTLGSITGLDNSQWHHVVSTWDGTTLKVYVDGVLDVTDTTLAGTMITTANDFQVGGRGGNYWQGQLDEVALYDRALSASEILNHYTIGIGDQARAKPLVLEQNNAGVLMLEQGNSFWEEGI